MTTKTSKAAIARYHGVSRQSLYYRPRNPNRDALLRERVLSVLETHQAYGHRRIALELGINKKCVLRIMRKYHIEPKLKRKKYIVSWKENSLQEIPNRIKGMCPIQPDVVWAGDFTHLRFFGREVYLATVIDLYTREVISWQIGLHPMPLR